MTQKVDLENALKEAMRAKDEMRKATLRLVLSAIRLAEIEQKGQPLDENAILAVLQKEVKSREEVIQDARRAGRPDLEAGSQKEMQILQEFLPSPLSQPELEELARQAIDESGATSLREMGQVMKVLVPKLEGRATGSQASQVVRKLLEG